MTLYPSSSHIVGGSGSDSDSVFAQARNGAFKPNEDTIAQQAAEQSDAKETAVPANDDGTGGDDFNFSDFLKSMMPTPEQIAQMRGDARRRFKSEIVGSIALTLENLSAATRIFAELAEDLVSDANDDEI